MIETKRLVLRNFSGSDKEMSDMLKNWAADPAVQHEYGEPVHDTREKVKALMERYVSEPYRWAVYEKKSGECIGQIALCKIWEDVRTAEIEYCIGRAFQGSGYAGEALEAAIAWLFENTGFQKLEAYHRAANPRSGSVLRKSVMRPVETVERFVRQGKTPEGEACYCVTAEEYFAARGR